MADADKFVLVADGGDVSRAADLRRIKMLATLVLVACVGVLVVAKIYERQFPALGYLAAFAEAATIGGLADWYAVVALFRRPLGLPIPHTAIIQQNQHRIAEKLGEFIEVHFLSAAPVNSKLREVDFAKFISDWLQDRKKSSDLARFILRLLPAALDAAETSGLKDFVTRRVLAQVKDIDVAPLAAGALRGFFRDRRHQSLLNDLLGALNDTVTKPETLALLRDKIREELPTLLRLYRADAFLLKRIAASATSFLEEVRADPAHPFRDEFDRILMQFVDKLEREPMYADKLDGLKRDLLARPELTALGNDIWQNVKQFIDRSASGDSDVLQNHLTNVLVEAGRQLAGDKEMRGEINNGIVVVLRSFIAEQKSGVSLFISDQVKSWNMNQLINLIEINIGRDLQYIRFNGALIGGLAGLALYSAEKFIRTL
ncbi:MAG: DUF445 family protein [Afipia sp.]|nr:DUF445 family protein [Afipia sp.]